MRYQGQIIAEKLVNNVNVIRLFIPSFLLTSALFWGSWAYASSRVSLIDDVEVNEVDHDSVEIPLYDRRGHFGSWLHDKTGDTCFNTRALILKRDSRKGVKTDRKNMCRVVKGQWKGHYSGGTFVNARNVDIDHIVPLHNAYYSGAWKWTDEKRCHYNNYMENSYHLITVSKAENRSKSAYGPEVYMPPEESFRCRYLGYWLKVKKVWELTMTPLEYGAIQEQLTELNCESSVYTMSRGELEREQEKVRQIPDACFGEI